jgi:hypothetical protein
MSGYVASDEWISSFLQSFFQRFLSVSPYLYSDELHLRHTA